MSMSYPVQNLTVFADFTRIAVGLRDEVLLQLRAMTFAQDTSVRVFDDQSGECLDFDLRPNAPLEPDMGIDPSLAASLCGVNRRRLGLAAHEVTLLPRHWEWLNCQPGGASATLRRLVDESRKANQERDAVRTSREAAYRFMSNIASGLLGFESATRALFAGERTQFNKLVSRWPADVQTQLAKLAAAGWNSP